MKKSIILTFALAAAIIACKPKKEVAKTESGPSEKQLAAAKTRFPDVTMDQLKKGQNIFNTSCTRCHAAKDVTPYTEKELSGILDNMAEKAELKADEKDAVWKYAMAVRLAK